VHDFKGGHDLNKDMVIDIRVLRCALSGFGPRFRGAG